MKKYKLNKQSTDLHKNATKSIKPITINFLKNPMLFFTYRGEYQSNGQRNGEKKKTNSKERIE